MFAHLVFQYQVMPGNNHLKATCKYASVALWLKCLEKLYLQENTANVSAQAQH